MIIATRIFYFYTRTFYFLYTYILFFISSSDLYAASLNKFNVDTVELRKNIKILTLMTWINMSLNEHFIIFSSSNVIIINIMTREIEIEILDQSDIISRNILKSKKRDVQKLINDLLSISSKYIFISISFRKFTSHEKLLLKSQISLILFQLFFCSFVLQIMINHINMKIHLKRVEIFMHVKS
jgi:hypothetical protein